MLIVVQLLLVLAYTVLSHLAGSRHDQALGAGALAVLALLVLIKPLVRLRPVALLALVLAVVGIAWLYRHGQTLAPMLLVPPAFMGLVATWFGRSLAAGSVPLITRIVSGIEDMPADHLAPDLQQYTRRLTLAWACLLGGLALLNLALALIAVPDGLIAQLGGALPVSVTRTQWSWVANVVNYGVIAGFFIAEYHWRKRRFPGRYASLFDFLRRLGALGPEFWRDFLR